jgi:hypothetical protein
MKIVRGGFSPSVAIGRAGTKLLLFVAALLVTLRFGAAFASEPAANPASGPTPSPSASASVALPSPAHTTASTWPEGPSVAFSEPGGEPSDYCVSRFVSPLQAMAGSLPRSEPDTRPWLYRVGAAAQNLSASFGNGRALVPIDVLIATVADPVDSGLGYEYEISLQALRRGIERAIPTPDGTLNLFRDRSFLPWDDRDGTDQTQKQSEACRTSMPGVILFRSGADEAPHLLAALLVGESPTTGLRRAAMFNALDIANHLLRRPAFQSATIRIVGPTFSGSAQSLRQALLGFAQKRQPQVVFSVRSGTATGSDVPTWLGRPGAPLTFPDGSYAVFDATTVPEADAECAYFNFLNRRLGVQPERDPTPAEPSVPLEGVATLSESGTEFGATGPGSGSSGKIAGQEPRGDAPGGRANQPLGCAFRAATAFAFPFHVSALRDAYEALDQRDASVKSGASIARATSLDPSLRDARVPLDIEANPSPKTQTAEDLAFSSVLERLVTRNVRFLGIHATDMGDAIFMARKIRDVAPDVRLAFFQADVLLLHSAFSRELLGSLVVGPYPFLGASELVAPGVGSAAPLFDGFENGGAEGLYNAVLAERAEALGVKNSLGLLSEYTLGSHTPLPIWISTIGRGTLVPNRVTPTPDCTRRLYGTPADNPAAALCSARPEDWARRRPEFVRRELDALEPYPRASLPNLWFLLFVACAFGLFIDLTRQNRQERMLALDAVLVPGDKGVKDQTLDLAIGRTKWRFYATIRSFLFALAFAYIGSLHLAWFLALGGLERQAFRASGSHLPLYCVVVLVSAALFLLAALFSWQAGRRFARDYVAFARWGGAHLWPQSLRDVADSLRTPASSGAEERTSEPPKKQSSAPPVSAPRLRDRVSLSFGIARPVGREESARISFAQLRLLVTMSLVLSLAFSGLLVTDVWNWLDGGSANRLALRVLRDVRLMSGVCPSTPALLCLGCVYLWSVGRMARLTLAHASSRAAPPDGEVDLVSTPIRLILQPKYQAGTNSDAGFTEVERDVLNAIWRPITGAVYPMVALVILTFPVVIFSLEPLSTLETTAGAWLLRGGLWLSVSLIGVTLVQLVQYWLALQRLLKRTLEHALGSAFASVPAFARDSIDHQMSRTPDEALRWAACARLFCDLVHAAKLAGKLAFLVGEEAKLAAQSDGLALLRLSALAGKKTLDAGASGEASVAPSVHPARERADCEAALAQGVIAAASTTMRIVEAGTSFPLPLSDAGKQWLEAARTFVATSVTLLIHRHVRQFRFFMQVMTGCTLLLLFAVTSYPFEPYRMLLTFSWVVVLSVVLLGLWTFIQLDRNTLMSHVSGTRAGEVTLNWAFGLRIVGWGVIPLLSVAAAQYPQIASLVFRTLSPFSGLLH